MDERIRKEPDAQNFAMASRERAATVLRDRARVMRTEAYKLEQLADAAERIHGEAEEALWKIVISRPLT